MWRGTGTVQNNNGQSAHTDKGYLPAMGLGAERRWPLFIISLLLSVILLGASPWLYEQLVTRRNYDFQACFETELQTSGVYSSPTEMTYNPFGANVTYERAVEILNCTTIGWPNPSPTVLSNNTALPGKECPSYFRYIHKDLAPWKETGITQQMIENAKQHAGFRAVILSGKLYIDRFLPRNCWQSRGVNIMWGLLLFLEKFKGKVPDLEFVFNCEDRPRLLKAKNAAKGPPILLAFDTNSEHFDVPFPDWSFWGWPELLISSWDEKRETIISGSRRTEWEQKVPMAYWTGNPWVGAPHRHELVKCNKAKLTEIRPQDWGHEIKTGKEHSKLEDQCTHRHMIYTEGNGWSVSLKYIFSCGSPVLAIKPSMYDFFSRGLRQWVHYIPIRPAALVAPELCDALDEGVNFGEANHTQAVRIGKAGQDFMRNELSMENVYSYMFHLLQEYASLLTFQPIQGDAHLVTLDHALCLKQFETDYLNTLQQARKEMPTNVVPCQISYNSGAINFEEPDWES